MASNMHVDTFCGGGSPWRVMCCSNKCRSLCSMAMPLNSIFILFPPSHMVREKDIGAGERIKDERKEEGGREKERRERVG